MRIDTHQHFWRYNPVDFDWIDESMSRLRRDFLPEHLRPELDLSGFDGTIAVQARQTTEETLWLLELAAASPFIAGVIGWVDLRLENVRSQLAGLAVNSKLLGVRHIVESEADDRFLMQPEFLRGICVLAEFDLTYDILIRAGQLPVAAEFVSRFPAQRFVLDHLANPLIKNRNLQPWENNIRKLARFPNVACKVSGLVTQTGWNSWKSDDIRPYLDVAFDSFGPERLMIGSDWPVCLLAASYHQTMDVVLEYLDRYPASIRDAVLGGTANKLWKLTSRNQMHSYHC